MRVALTAVSEADKVVLANLLQLYCYDFSEFDGEELTPHGTFTYRYLDHYFTDADREACLITADGRLAGFTMTRLLDDGGHQVVVGGNQAAGGLTHSDSSASAVVGGASDGAPSGRVRVKL